MIMETYQQPEAPGFPLPFPFLPDNEMVEEPILPTPPPAEPEKKDMIKSKQPAGSVLLHKLGVWEVRITPLNKIFIFNEEKSQLHWPFLGKNGAVKFTGSQSYSPPQAILDTVKKGLFAKRAVRQQHGEDFDEGGAEQYVFN